MAIGKVDCPKIAGANSPIFKIAGAKAPIAPEKIVWNAYDDLGFLVQPFKRLPNSYIFLNSFFNPDKILIPKWYFIASWMNPYSPLSSFDRIDFLKCFFTHILNSLIFLTDNCKFLTRYFNGYSIVCKRKNGLGAVHKLRL